MSNNLLTRMKTTKDKTEYLKLRAMYLYIVEKKKAEEVAKQIGTTEGMVYQWAYIYKHEGITGFINKPKGGRTWAYLTLEQEKELLNESRNDETQGSVPLSAIVRKKVEQVLGRSVSADYVEDLLNRHGWRAIIPNHKKRRAELKNNASL